MTEITINRRFEDVAAFSLGWSWMCSLRFVVLSVSDLESSVEHKCSIVGKWKVLFSGHSWVTFTSGMFLGSLFECKWMFFFTWNANNLINKPGLFVLGYHRQQGWDLLACYKNTSFMSSVPPSSSFCLRGTWKRLLCRPLGLSASLCWMPALLWLLGSGFLTKMRCGDHVSARRKEASVFSHSLSGSPGKNSSHSQVRGCATRRVAVFHGKSAVRPCLISWTGRKGKDVRELHPFSSCV